MSYDRGIQPHGVLLVLDALTPRILHASANTADLIGIAAERLLGKPIEILGESFATQVHARYAAGIAELPAPFRASLQCGGSDCSVEALIHRNDADAVLLELEPADPDQAPALARDLPLQLADAIAQLGAAPSLEALASSATQVLRDMTGYERVLFCRFDTAGNGEILAEAAEPSAVSLVGLHYPRFLDWERVAARPVRQRIRLLVDVEAEPVALLSHPQAADRQAPDIGPSGLRSVAPHSREYVKSLGVRATLTAALVRENRLWGLLICQHGQAHRVPYAARAACDLLAEIISTRIAVLENFVQLRTVALVRRLEKRLIDATFSIGDWKRALLEDPWDLLRMVGASGAVIVHDGEILTTGDVPSTQALRELIDWIHSRPGDATVFASATVARDAPGLAAHAATASGVLAVALSRQDREYLLWLRGEQAREIRWAAGASVPTTGRGRGRRAAPAQGLSWIEEIRSTSKLWTGTELATAEAVGASIRDIALQVRAMSYLITEERLARLRRALQDSGDGVLIADGAGRVRFVNEAFSQIFRRPHVLLSDLADLPKLFNDKATIGQMVQAVTHQRQNWRGELLQDTGTGRPVALGVRADVIPQLEGGQPLGHIVLVTRLPGDEEADAARERAQRAIQEAQQPFSEAGMTPGDLADFHQLLHAVLTNASTAVMEVADESAGAVMAQTLDSLEASTKRATDLTLQMIAYASGGDLP